MSDNIIESRVTHMREAPMTKLAEHNANLMRALSAPRFTLAHFLTDAVNFDERVGTAFFLNVDAYAPRTFNSVIRTALRPVCEPKSILFAITKSASPVMWIASFHGPKTDYSLVDAFICLPGHVSRIPLAEAEGIVRAEVVAMRKASGAAFYKGL